MRLLRKLKVEKWFVFLHVYVWCTPVFLTQNGISIVFSPLIKFNRLILIQFVI